MKKNINFVQKIGVKNYLCPRFENKHCIITKKLIVNTLSYKTKSATPDTIKRSWFVVDAEDQTLGRMATKIAHVLRGKNKAYYSPHLDCGDYVVVINAEKVKMSGNKWTQKEYQRYSGYPGGQKTLTAQQLLEKKPEAIIETAVKGMLPKNKLGRAMYKKLFVYTGGSHPHGAQTPESLNL
jgi:large subunit ribosomal protein L13